MRKENKSKAALRAAFLVPAALTALLPQLSVAAVSAPPSLISPANGTSNVPLSGIMFSWSPTAGASSYRLVISQDPNFSGFIKNACDGTCFTTVIGSTNYAKALSVAGQPYYWKVLANNNANWSSTRFFNTAGELGKLIWPMEKNQKWIVCQGYNNPYITHNGNLASSFDLSLDLNSANGMTKYGCLTNGYNPSQGQPVYAPASGKILASPFSNAKDMACISLFNPTTNGAKSVLLGHFPALDAGVKVGGNVAKGMRLAFLGKDSNSFGGYAHHHISTHSTTNCTGASIPFKTVFGGSKNFTNNGVPQQWRKEILIRN